MNSSNVSENRTVLSSIAPETLNNIIRFAPAMEGYIQFFGDYALSFLTQNEEIDRHLLLKKEHSLRVMANAWDITKGEDRFERRKGALLAALFHDMGRFEQFTQYRTFVDSLSVNHGTLSAQLLMREGVVSKESFELQRHIKTAVLLHNRRETPQGIKDDALYTLQVVRDADKIDILGIMAPLLEAGGTIDTTILMHLQDIPHAISPAFAAYTQGSEPLEYTAMQYVNDFRMLQISWINQFCFPQSIALALQKGHMTRIASGLEGVPRVMEKAYALLEQTRVSPA